MTTRSRIDAEFTLTAKPSDETVAAFNQCIPGDNERAHGWVFEWEGTYKLIVNDNISGLDDNDAASVLAWFIAVCAGYFPEVVWGTLVFTVGEDGPRYRYAWRDEALTRLRGILE